MAANRNIRPITLFEKTFFITFGLPQFELDQSPVDPSFEHPSSADPRTRTFSRFSERINGSQLVCS
jgi:hypothetical protein